MGGFRHDLAFPLVVDGIAIVMSCMAMGDSRFIARGDKTGRQSHADLVCI